MRPGRPQRVPKDGTIIMETFITHEYDATMTYQHPPQQVTYQVVKPPTNGMATTSLTLGIIAIVIGIWSFIPLLGLGAAFTSFLPAVLAVIFGHIGLKKVREGNVGSGQATTGLILGYITVGIIVLTTLFWIIAMAANAGSTTTM